MEEILINSWEELLKQLDDNERINPLYRGVRNSEYNLTPKIGRPGAVKGGWSEFVERQVLFRFKLSAYSYVDDLNAEGHDTEWLQVGQHYGLPTRLLDWSFNPLVAAYFAVEGDSEGTDAAIYKYTNVPSVNTYMPDIFKIKEVAFLMPYSRTSRIAAQSGVFTVHNEPCNSYDDGAIKKLLIPNELRDQIKKKLSHFGINHSTLFPDLGGIAAHLTWHISSEELLDPDG